MNPKILVTDLIQQVITTPYEKVILILKDIKTFLSSMEKNESQNIQNHPIPYSRFIEDLDFVISTIETRTLYTYDINLDSEIIKQCQKSNSKFKDLVEFITGDADLFPVNFQRSEFYAKARKEMNLKRDTKFKRSTLIMNNRQRKQVQQLRNEKFVLNFLHIRSKSQSHEHEKKIINIPSTETEEVRNGKRLKSTKGQSSTIKKRNNSKTAFDLRENNKNLIYPNNIFSPNISVKSAEIILNLQEVEGFHFNILDFQDKVGYDKVLPMIGKYIYDKLGFQNLVDMKKLDNFLSAVNKGYLQTTLYHNAIHGTDVSQSVTSYFLNSDIDERLCLSRNDILYTITASLGHDLGHPGQNNNFHINANSELAVTYNDMSILENFHTAFLFRILKDKENNIFYNYSNADLKYLRKRIISIILATDMFFHGKVYGTIKSKVSLEIEKENPIISLNRDSSNLFQEQQAFLDFFVHIADLGHNTKKFEVTKRWVNLLNQEMKKQNELEKQMNLPSNIISDRGQIGFINGFIIPCFEVLATIAPSLDLYLINAKENLKEWEKQFSKENNEEEK